MRPSELLMMVLGVIAGIGALALGVYQLVDRSGGNPWFFWIAPLLALGFGGVMFNLVAQYYLKVGRLETKGRPRK
ncbi:MAG: hypothetical protein ACKOBG_11120 [Actinomycetota bacterium]